MKMFWSVVFFLLGCVDFENDYSKDGDGDGFTTYEGDCDDDDASLSPRDGDGDGVSSCDGDCNDEDELINPEATEVCDEEDNNCDEVVDADATDAPDWYVDADADSFGAGLAVPSCAQPEGHVANSEDCDDDNASLTPEDVDGDGVSTCENDCDDTNANRFPNNVEVCDDIDNDCNGSVDDDAVDADIWYVDADGDGDGFGDGEIPVLTCAFSDGSVENAEDCDDTNEAFGSIIADADCDGVLTE